MHFRINVRAFHAFVYNVIKNFVLNSAFPFFFVMEQMYEGSIAINGVPECDEAPPTVRTTQTRVRPSASQSRDHEWCLDKLVTDLRIKCVHPTTTLSTSALFSPPGTLFIDLTSETLGSFTSFSTSVLSCLKNHVSAADQVSCFIHSLLTGSYFSSVNHFLELKYKMKYRLLFFFCFLHLRYNFLSA